MLLIILGHNKYLMADGDCFRFLYSFHVYGFYFLPFLYGSTEMSFGAYVLKNIRRLFIPYTMMFFFLLFGVLLISPMASWETYCTAFVCGSQEAIRGALNCGGFLWFIPTLFSLLLLKYLFYHVGRKMRLLMLVCSFASLVNYAFGLSPEVTAYAPFSFFTALAMLFPAVMCRTLATRVSLPAASLSFFVFVLLVFIIYNANNEITYKILNRIVSPVTVFIFLYSLKECLSKSELLCCFGKFSFAIYFVHILLYNAIYALNLNFSPFLGAILYGMVTVLSFQIAKLRHIASLFKS